MKRKKWYLVVLDTLKIYIDQCDATQNIEHLHFPQTYLSILKQSLYQHKFEVNEVCTQLRHFAEEVTYVPARDALLEAANNVHEYFIAEEIRNIVNQDKSSISFCMNEGGAVVLYTKGMELESDSVSGNMLLSQVSIKLKLLGIKEVRHG